MLGPTEPFGFAPAADGEDPVRVLHHPLTGGPLLHDGDEGVVLEADRRVDPEEAARGVGGADPRGFRLADRSHAPRAVPGPPPTVRRELEFAVSEAEASFPRPDLGETGRVEDDPLELPVEVPSFEVCFGEPLVDRIELDAPLVRFHDDTDLLETSEDLDPDRPDGGVHPVGAERLRRAHDAVCAVPEHRHERVGDSEVGVLADADDREEIVLAPVLLATRVDVEVVAVVEIAIGRADESHRLGDLMDRVVVERGEHGHSWSRRPAAGSDPTGGGSRRAYRCPPPGAGGTARGYNSGPDHHAGRLAVGLVRQSSREDP